MLQIPLWKRVFIFGLVAIGLLYAMPNLFYGRVELHNDAVAEIEALGATPERQAAAAGWPSWLPGTIVNLGLDLRGGAHLRHRAGGAVDIVGPHRLDRIDHHEVGFLSL